MAEDSTRSKRAKLSQMLRELLGRPVAIKNLNAQEVAALVEGYQTMTNGEALAEKLMQLAVQGKEWAVQIVLERTEGRAVQASKEDGSDRSTEEKLDHVTQQHLNTLAKSFAASITETVHEPNEQPVSVGAATEQARDIPPPRPAFKPAGPASRLLDLPKDGPVGS